MNIYRKIRHTFVAHKDNDHKPHILREFSILIIIFLSAFMLGVSYGSSYFIHKTVLGASVASSVLVDLANETRLSYNEPILVRNPILDNAAKLKGEDMISKGYFAHDSPDGITPWYWFKKVGYNFIYAGENLAINFTNSEDVQDAWMKSPLHRANLLNVQFREIGMSTQAGVYNGEPTIFVVQMFGTPSLENKSKIISFGNNVSENENFNNINDSTDGIVKGETSNKNNNLDSEMAVIINKDVIESDMANQERSFYSKWYERIIFNGSDYVNVFYKILLIVIGFSLLTMLFVEYKKQHWKHISYGVFTLIFIISCIYINSNFFN